MSGIVNPHGVGRRDPRQDPAVEAIARERPAPSPEVAAAPMPPSMSIQTANALVTHAPISEEQLRAAMVHFKALAALTAVSGPRFANANRDAVALHNTCVARLRESREAALRRDMRHREVMEGLTEIGDVV